MQPTALQPEESKILGTTKQTSEIAHQAVNKTLEINNTLFYPSILTCLKKPPLLVY